MNYVIFGNPEIKLVQKYTFYSRKNEKLTFCDPGLSQLFPVVHFHEVRLQNSFDFFYFTCKSDYKLCASHRKRIFDSGEFRDLRDLTLTLTLTLT